MYAPSEFTFNANWSPPPPSASSSSESRAHARNPRRHSRRRPQSRSESESGSDDSSAHLNLNNKNDNNIESYGYYDSADFKSYAEAYATQDVRSPSPSFSFSPSLLPDLEHEEEGEGDGDGSYETFVDSIAAPNKTESESLGHHDFALNVTEEDQDHEQFFTSERTQGDRVFDPRRAARVYDGLLAAGIGRAGEGVAIREGDEDNEVASTFHHHHNLHRDQNYRYDELDNLFEERDSRPQPQSQSRRHNSDTYRYDGRAQSDRSTLSRSSSRLIWRPHAAHADTAALLSYLFGPPIIAGAGGTDAGSFNTASGSRTSAGSGVDTETESDGKTETKTKENTRTAQRDELDYARLRDDPGAAWTDACWDALESDSESESDVVLDDINVNMDGDVGPKDSAKPELEPESSIVGIEDEVGDIDVDTLADEDRASGHALPRFAQVQASPATLKSATASLSTLSLSLLRPSPVLPNSGSGSGSGLGSRLTSNIDIDADADTRSFLEYGNDDDDAGDEHYDYENEHDHDHELEEGNRNTGENDQSELEDQDQDGNSVLASSIATYDGYEDDALALESARWAQAARHGATGSRVLPRADWTRDRLVRGVPLSVVTEIGDGNGAQESSKQEQLRSVFSPSTPTPVDHDDVKDLEREQGSYNDTAGPSNSQRFVVSPTTSVATPVLTPPLRFSATQRVPPYSYSPQATTTSGTAISGVNSLLDGSRAGASPTRFSRLYRAMSDPPPYTADAEEGTYTLMHAQDGSALAVAAATAADMALLDSTGAGTGTMNSTMHMAFMAAIARGEIEVPDGTIPPSSMSALAAVALEARPTMRRSSVASEHGPVPAYEEATTSMQPVRERADEAGPFPEKRRVGSSSGTPLTTGSSSPTTTLVTRNSRHNAGRAVLGPRRPLPTPGPLSLPITSLRSLPSSPHTPSSSTRPRGSRAPVPLPPLPSSAPVSNPLPLRAAAAVGSADSKQGLSSGSSSGPYSATSGLSPSPGLGLDDSGSGPKSAMSSGSNLNSASTSGPTSPMLPTPLNSHPYPYYSGAGAIAVRIAGERNAEDANSDEEGAEEVDISGKMQLQPSRAAAIKLGSSSNPDLSRSLSADGAKSSGDVVHVPSNNGSGQLGEDTGNGRDASDADARALRALSSLFAPTRAGVDSAPTDPRRSRRDSERQQRGRARSPVPLPLVIPLARRLIPRQSRPRPLPRLPARPMTADAVVSPGAGRYDYDGNREMEGEGEGEREADGLESEYGDVLSPLSPVSGVQAHAFFGRHRDGVLAMAALVPAPAPAPASTSAATTSADTNESGIVATTTGTTLARDRSSASGSTLQRFASRCGTISRRLVEGVGARDK